MKRHCTRLSLSLLVLSCLQIVAPGTATAADAPNAKSGYPVAKMSAIAANIDWVGTAVDDPDYYVWCVSPILGPEGKVHLFCSRWPKRLKFNGWSKECEIAHYVGDRPEGPFKFADVAIAANPKAEFNNAIHNPAIARAGDKYVLLYITFDRSREHVKDPPDGRMLTCMATSDSLAGPWKRVGETGQIIAPSPDRGHWTYNPWAMDNPTFLAFGGKYYIYFKAAPRGRQMECRYGYAVADKLEGPYTLSDKPCTDNTSYIEDATAFVWQGKVCLLTTDNFGRLTGIEGAASSGNPTFRPTSAWPTPRSASATCRSTGISTSNTTSRRRRSSTPRTTSSSSSVPASS